MLIKKIAFVIICFSITSLLLADGLEVEFQNPSREAGVRCWWWWLNGNVTKEAITRDLEAMHEKGFRGAMIFDAGGANQRGNAQVPAGPLYGSSEWTELYLHALNEAQRLDLKISMLIQSGWNLGGPNVTADFAAKQLTWSEIQIVGPANYSEILPGPYARSGYYRDICVLAYKNKSSIMDVDISASSSQSSYPASLASDGGESTFWVSSGVSPGEGPTETNPEWLEFTIDQPVTVSGLKIQGREGYGPKKIQVLCPDENKETSVFDVEEGTETFQFSSMQGNEFRILILDAYDSGSPTSPRNVQVVEVSLLDDSGEQIFPLGFKPIQNLSQKAGFSELGSSAPDTRYLLNDYSSEDGEEDLLVEDVLNLTANMSSEATLNWDVPEGQWTVLRFGYTITSSQVSTSSGDWDGRVIDFLSAEAFERYWNEVVDPLLVAAGPLVGTVLEGLETDSWECGGMNWSPGFAEDFKDYCRYDPIPYLPVIAGKIIHSRDASNAFLADFRKTIGHFVSENHYKVFAEHAARYNLGIQPESAGPHAGPLDGIKNYQHNDIVMSEFWVPSPHRPTPENRFFVKQASSAAHIYGKKYVGAESFTSIGPHWNDVLWKSQKPSMDHEFCSGLNMIFFHTFTCSPKEMGIPGQEYFAGTHINPQVTWWDYSDAFIDYIARIQSVVQQGKFVADVLYYYGDHVPNIFSLKESDPAGAMPGYDYDVTNEDVLLKVKVRDGKMVVPGGISYRMLVLPDHQVLSLAVLEKVHQLLQQGATVVGPKPKRLVSLVGGQSAQQRFKELADQLWTINPADKGERKIGRGRLIWGQTARQILQSDGLVADFEVMNQVNPSGFDYIHYTIEDADVYFVCNQTDQPRSAKCAFRVTGKQPELWDPVTGRTGSAASFYQTNQQTVLPMAFAPYGSCMVVLRTPIESDARGTAVSNDPVLKTIQKLKGPWQVSFDSEWAGPESIQFDTLMDWTQHKDPGVRFYSGKAVYKKTFDFQESPKAPSYWLTLNCVEDIGIAVVTLNGQDLGVLWTKPFSVEITNLLKSGTNHLEITVVNSWRNRLVGDRDKPQSQRYTQTNIKIRKDWKQLPSGLIGPVVIQSGQ